MLPWPVYRACFGYAQSGRVRPGHGVALRAVATMRSGGLPFSTQPTSASNASNWSVDGPPAQWFMPGTANSLTNRSARPAFALSTSFHQLIVSRIEKIGSLTPCAISSLPPRFLNTERSVESAFMKSSDAVRYAPDVTDNARNAPSISMPREYAAGPPVDGVGTGGVTKIPERAAAP